jgi:hypothetical protein
MPALLRRLPRGALMRRMAAWPLGVVLLCLSIFAEAPADHKRVLVIYSIRRDAQFSILGERELPKTLIAAFGPDLDYYSEFIDTVRFPEASYRKALRDFLTKKYQDVRMDLVIAVQDEAVELLNTDILFRDAPEVFVTTDSRAPRRANSAGLIHGRDFRGTVSLMRRLQPDLQHVYIVTGANQVDGEYAQLVQRQLQPFASQLTLTYLSGLSTSDLTKRLAKLPPHSAVYYVLVNQDATGQIFHPLDYATVVSNAANAPTYSWTDSVMDHGIVGGSLYRQKGVYARLGDLAIRVLHGENPDRIPLSLLSLNVNEVDWRQLRRWGINEALVPDGTIISFRNPGVWERYRAYVLAGISVLILQSVLIATLLIQRRRRRIAEQQLRGSQTELLTT